LEKDLNGGKFDLSGILEKGNRKDQQITQGDTGSAEGGTDFYGRKKEDQLDQLT